MTAKDYGEHYPTNDAGTKQNIKIEKGLTIDVKYDLDEHTLTFETNGGSAHQLGHGPPRQCSCKTR